MKSRLFLLFQLVAATTSPLERTASDYESETTQERYESYAKQGNVKLEDLDENTRFIFFRDDPFRRFMTRTSEWMNFMMFIMNLNYQQDKLKFVFVYTQIERVSEMAIQGNPYKWRVMYDMDKLSAALPFVEWDVYLAYLRQKQGVHESEQPSIVLDEIVVLQQDENIATDRIKAFQSGSVNDIQYSHQKNVACYPHGYNLETKKRKSREPQWTGNFWKMREGIRAAQLGCHSLRGSLNALAPYMVASNSTSFVVDAKLCPTCVDVFLAEDESQTAVEWRTFDMRRLTTPISMKWHIVRAFDVSEALRTEIAEYKMTTTMQKEEFVSLVYYSEGTDEQANYVKLQKQKFDVDHVYIQSLRGDQETMDTYNKLVPGVWMMSTLQTNNHRAFGPEEIELYGFHLSVQAKSFLGMVNCPLTTLVFQKRATNFKTDATNFLYSCLSLKCKTGYGIEKRMVRYSQKYWTQPELNIIAKLRAKKDEL